jgi:hypothetical protein
MLSAEMRPRSLLKMAAIILVSAECSPAEREAQRARHQLASVASVVAEVEPVHLETVQTVRMVMREPEAPAEPELSAMQHQQTREPVVPAQAQERPV